MSAPRRRSQPIRIHRSSSSRSTCPASINKPAAMSSSPRLRHTDPAKSRGSGGCGLRDSFCLSGQRSYSSELHPWMHGCWSGSRLCSWDSPPFWSGRVPAGQIDAGRVVYLLDRSMLVGVAILLGGGAILRDGATLAAVTVLLIEVAILFRPELLRRPVAWWTKRDDVPLAEDDSESPSAL
jgi:hypothetical protein